ncbi:MAG TPA: hypothetical protein VFD67_05160 [Gemmatimonadaceae bacterium]|nr:hypothetical protein [Gemmatimonadaceae bacterium]
MPSVVARTPEPRWPVALALLAAAGLHFVLPRALVMGPPWMVLGSVATLIALAYFARYRHWWTWNERFAYAALGLLTAALAFGLGGLLYALPRRLEAPGALLRSAAVLWVTNVLVFASWYWRLDAGGPNARDVRDTHVRGAFLFPQMLLPGADASMVAEDEALPEPSWRPGFVDYLFLAFNTSTAFSPTDVPVLSRWAKAMMMVQSVISFTSVAVIAARAVNIL